MVLGAGLPLAATLAGCADSGSGSVAAPSPLASRTGRVQVRVDGTAPRARRESYLADALDAVAPVEQVWGKNAVPTRVHLTAPATAAEFTELTGSTSDAVPALTRPDGRVVIHPDLWGRASAPGRQVVLTHEVTHVALGQGGWPDVPRWVVEGSAEFTAYRRTELAPERIAPSVARRVRAGDGPTGPPSETQMAGPDGYSLAWTWCQYLVSRSGQAVFVRFVRRAGRNATAAGTRRAFRATYGVDPGALAAGYSTWLASWE